MALGRGGASARHDARARRFAKPREGAAAGGGVDRCLPARAAAAAAAGARLAISMEILSSASLAAAGEDFAFSPIRLPRSVAPDEGRH